MSDLAKRLREMADIDEREGCVQWAVDLVREAAAAIEELARDARSVKFQAVGYVDHEGMVHWEPGRRPHRERMLYVSKDAAIDSARGAK